MADDDDDDDDNDGGGVGGEASPSVGGMLVLPGQVSGWIRARPTAWRD